MRYGSLIILLISVLTGGCVSLATDRMADQLSDAILNQNDPETVRAGAPAYLLLLDSLINGDPKNTSRLLAGSRLYGAYATALVEDPERRRKLTEKSRDYAGRALCLESPPLCGAPRLAYREFTPALAKLDSSDLPVLYAYATAWLGWIQARSDDWNAIADLPKAEYMLDRVTQMEPGYGNGRAQLYLAMLQSLRPPALGGKPEQAREHFEQAIRHSGGRDLMVKVEYARRYARMVFDKPLHDRLLDEVLKADPDQPGFTLSNVMAQRQANLLLRDEYF